MVNTVKDEKCYSFYTVPDVLPSLNMFCCSVMWKEKSECCIYKLFEVLENGYDLRGGREENSICFLENIRCS